ncbi:MAG: hypothetical protein PHU53_04555 [Thermoplasmata archaeon]|nr:hypothetical protein [Thermoplasmata archaeon]
MESKFKGIQNIVTGIKNAFGFGKNRGGAGVAIAALAVCSLVACMTGMSVGGSADSSPEAFTSVDTSDVSCPPSGEIPEPEDNQEVVPWEKPPVQLPETNYHGAMPSRLPC